MARLGYLATFCVIAQLVASAAVELSQSATIKRGHVCPLSTCATNPILPRDDSWYMRPPTNFAFEPPGTLLRARVAPGNLPAVVANSSAAYQILYTTTGSRGQRTWAVATLILPSNSLPNYGDTLLSYQIPYDANDVNASPSYLLSTAGWAPSDIPTVLGRGWHVLTADYEGPLASFTAGVMSGHATLDAVRAILSGGCAERFGLKPHANYAMWGYSGGSIASGWAAELQPTYAPELNFAGTAMGGLVPNVTEAMYQVDNTLSAGLIPEWLVGVTTQFPDARKYLLSVLKSTGPYNATTFMGVENSTSSGANFVFQEISNYFIHGFADLNHPIIQAITVSDGIMGYHGVPGMPLFVYKAVNDELSAGYVTTKLVDRYCSKGATIWYQLNTVGDHGGEAVTQAPKALQFLITALEGGGYKGHGCLSQTITDPAP